MAVGPKSDRKEDHSIDPFLLSSRGPNQNQVVHDLSKRQMLWNDEQTRTALCLHELAKLSRHRRLVVRHEDTAVACRTGKDFLVAHSG